MRRFPNILASCVVPLKYIKCSEQDSDRMNNNLGTSGKREFVPLQCYHEDSIPNFPRDGVLLAPSNYLSTLNPLFPWNGNSQFAIMMLR